MLKSLKLIAKRVGLELRSSSLKEKAYLPNTCGGRYQLCIQLDLCVTISMTALSRRILLTLSMWINRNYP